MQFSADGLLRPTPQGVFHGFDAHGDPTQRHLLQWLLLQPATTRRHFPAMAQALSLAPAVLIRTLFRMVRDDTLVVDEQAADLAAPVWQSDGMAALADDLADWARAGQCLLLSTDDGLALASTGWTGFAARAIAARRWKDAADGVQHRRMQFARLTLLLHWTDDLDEHHPALLRLAFRLLQPQSALPATPAVVLHVDHIPPFTQPC